MNSTQSNKFHIFEIHINFYDCASGRFMIFMPRFFTNHLLLVLLLAACNLFVAFNAVAHGGGLDAAGCHNDRKHGGYHCHRSGYVRPNISVAPEPQLFVPSLPLVESPVRKYEEPNISPNLKEAIPAAPTARISDWRAREQQERIDRSIYWKEQGYSFDPKYMSAYAMDQKVKDIERAQFWLDKGHKFNPQFMSAYAMDQKVKDIERAKYWIEYGHRFNPEFMSAYAMDQKVKDIERAKYWAERGLSFNPQYMSAYAMDREAERMRPLLNK